MSLRPKRSTGFKLFEEGYLLDEKRLAYFFSDYRVWQTSSNIPLSFTKFFGKYCASNKINSVTNQMLLKTQIFEKVYLHSENKNFGTLFTLFYVKQPHGVIKKSGNGTLTITLQVRSLIFWDLRVC